MLKNRDWSMVSSAELAMAAKIAQQVIYEHKKRQAERQAAHGQKKMILIKGRLK